MTIKPETGIKDILKSLAGAVFLVLAIPFYLLYRLESELLGGTRAFQGASQFFSLMPGTAGMYFRRAFYVMALKKCSADAYVGFGTIFSHPSAEIGKGVYIGTGCSIGDVSVADRATIGSNVDIINGGKQHCIDDDSIPVQDGPGEYPRVFIGEDAWLGNSSVIMASVGEKAVVGAGSVVPREVPARAVVAGNPARILRER